MRRRLPLRIPAVLFCAMFLIVGCGREAGQERVSRDSLVELTAPETQRQEAAVRAVLDQAWNELQELLVQPDAGDQALADAFGELGRVYHAYELFDAAVPAYRNARTLQPAEHRWNYYLGQVYRSLYKVDDARAALERARELQPNDTPTLVALAQAHRESQRFDEATELLRSVLARDSNSAAAILLMANIATDRGDAAGAVEQYERLLTLQPQATKLYPPLAMAYRRLGQLEKAEELLGRRGDGHARLDDPLMLELQTFVAGIKHELDQGIAAFNRGDFEGAVAAFRRAVALDDTHVAAHLNLGSALTRAGRTAEAITEFERVTELDPTHGMAHFNLGVIYARQGDDAKGIHHYEEALRINADYREPRFNLGNALSRTGRCAEAVEHYNRLSELDPRFAPARVGAALCLIRSETFDEAIRQLEEAVHVLPSDATLTEMLTRLLAACPRRELRNGDRALELAELLVANQRTPRSLEALAMAQAELGRFETAIRTQREAIGLAGGFPELQRRLEQNLERYRRDETSPDPAVS